MKFYKYQGAGNDFVIADNMNLQFRNKSEMAAKLCHRRFGIGADGFIAAEPSDTSDVKMAFYNADGSVAGMCGNGIRCFAKFVTDMGIVNTDTFSVETGDGEKHIQIISRSPAETRVRVDMGTYNAISRIVCSTGDGKNDRSFEVYHTHLGVPHAVIFCDTSGDGMKELDSLAETYGNTIEHAEAFSPAGTNVNFVEVQNEGNILCSTWERGAGKTLACGTGACSSALAAHMCMNCSDSVNVTMPGGNVTVSFDEDRTVNMEGTAVLTFSGEVSDMEI